MVQGVQCLVRYGALQAPLFANSGVTMIVESPVLPGTAGRGVSGGMFLGNHGHHISHRWWVRWLVAGRTVPQE